MRSTLLAAFVLVAVVAMGAGCNSNTYENGASRTDNQNAAPQGGPATPEANGNGARYKIDAGQSQFTVQVFTGGLLSSLGHDHMVALREVTGDVELTPGTIEPASLHLTIKANSAAEIAKEFDEKDRQKINEAIRGEALETAKYPEIIFKSTRVSATRSSEGQYQARIAGDLTLHGVTRPIAISAQVTIDGDNLRAQGEFPLKHSDYQIKQISAGGGAVKAKDEMKLSFNIVARKY